MKEWKMYNMENERKCAPRKMIEKSHLENGRMENAHLENDRKITPRKMTEKNERMENTRHGK